MKPRQRQRVIAVALIVAGLIGLALLEGEHPTEPDSLTPAPPAEAPVDASAPAPSAADETDAGEAQAVLDPEDVPLGKPGLTIRAERADLCDGGLDCFPPVPNLRIEVRRVPTEDEAATDAGARTVVGVTDEQGEFTLSDATPGWYVARALDTTLYSAASEFDFMEESMTYSLRVSALGSLELRVEDPNGHPVPGAHVALLVDQWALEVEADERGRVTLERAPEGRAELVATAPGFAEHHQQLTLAGATRATVTMAKGRTVVVKVPRAPGGPPLLVQLLGVTNQVQGLGSRAESVTFEQVPPDEYIVSVTDPSSHQSAIVAKVLPPTATELVLPVSGALLTVKLEGKRPNGAWANGKCCAPHFVRLKCEGAPDRRHSVNGPPATVKFQYVPAVPCFVSFDDGAETRVWPPEATLRVE